MSANKTHYYHLLNKEGQQAYYCIKKGLENLETSFPVPRLDGRELTNIYFMVRLDHPEIFYTVTFKYRYYPDSEMVELIPEYLFPKKQIKEHIQAMESRVKKLVRQAEGLDELGKEQYIHDFVVDNIHYDKLKKPYSHEIIGSLGHGVGVCEGIAKTVKILCDAMGIWCIIAISDANPEKKIKYRHAWNVIRIGGKYYHLDATFDNSLSNPAGRESQNKQAASPQGHAAQSKAAQGKGNQGKGKKKAPERDWPMRYDYYNLNDKQFFRDHEPVIWQVPQCTEGSHSWYQEKKLSFTKLEDVRKRAAQAAKKGKPFLFHWRGGYLTKEVLEELIGILREEGAAKNKHLYLSLNWPQAVLLAMFREEEKEESIVMEEANEGELYDGEA
ncbi:MAG: transglutaminase domain-containing protein [Lachnospiraceae bacterium]|nr:transglutaminase domain-containing protein [Lachnospiraceae bacterium]